MRFSFLLLLVSSALLATPGHAQSAAPLTGTVLDAQTQDPVPFASLAVVGRAGGTVSNEEGVFQLTVPAGADSVRVRALGYSPLTLAARSLAAAGGLTLRLQSQPFQLQEVTVTGLTPTTLIKRAVRQTTAQLINPLGLQAYYREFARYNGQMSSFGDALVDYYLEADPRRPRDPKVQVRVLESRVGRAALSKDDAEVALLSPIDVERAGNVTRVTAGHAYLDSANFARYTYALLETPAGAPEPPYYEVRCTPATHDAEYLTQGTVRIDRQTLLIQRVECEVPVALQPYTLSVNLLVARGKLTQLRRRREYQTFNGRVYPSFERLQTAMDITKGGVTRHYDFASEMLVRDLLPTPAPFPKSEQYHGALYKRGTHYSHPYWREGNTVAATAAEAAAIQTLEAAATK